jgi:hypothetical protein
MPLHPTSTARVCNLADEGWEELRRRLPGDLEQRARRDGALRRARKVDSGETLLRLLLLYALCPLSLRAAAAWAGRALGIYLTDDALNYRFLCALLFLRTLVQDLAREQMHVGTVQGPCVRILDATSLREPGTAGTDWLVHLTYTPGAGAVGFEVTDEHGGEHVERAAAQPGDLVVLDRGYGHTREVRALRANGREGLLRVHLQSLPVFARNGRRWDPRAVMRRARAGGFDQPVLLGEEGREAVEARLVVQPLPAERAARARQRLRKAASKKGRRPSALTLQLAGYFCCVTTVPAERLAASVVRSWYRIRWQVELWIKRSKSLLHLAHLTKANPVLASIQIWTRLLVALLVQRLHPPGDAAPCPGRPPRSEWRLTQIFWLDVLLAVYGGAPLATRLARTDDLDRLRERPRRRQIDAEAFAEGITRTLRDLSAAQAAS